MITLHLKVISFPIELRLENTFCKHSKYGIEKGGLFFITQLLAALYPMEYTAIELRTIQALRKFQITDITLKVELGKDILYFNQICTDLFSLSDNPYYFNLSYAHYFLQHSESQYLLNKTWDYIRFMHKNSPLDNIWIV
ncbi:hypothetical protein COC66_22035 [Bacillus cereus]|nr:hypothetical protein CN426_07900 [Bacillus thuringiensis]PGS52908.1 hypothetical protein COC66_22035 [Bacillus cereus]